MNEGTKTGPDYPDGQVHFLEIEGRQFILIGTAHVSKESAQLVRRVIENERPDSVCVELDSQRYKALTQERRWESLDLKEIIRKKQLSTLFINLLLFAYQRKLGLQMGVLPGTELLEATKVAEELGIPVVLCDRDVRITLKRAWRKTPFFKKLLLMSSIVASAFEEQQLSEDKLKEIMKGDALNELMKELGEAMPSLKEVLIDERDLYLTQKMLEAEGDRIVSIVGAGHVSGIKKALSAHIPQDLGPITQVPPVSPVWKIVGWGIPVVILGSIAYIGWTQGAAAAGDNAIFWILANGIPSALGALIALAHPAAVIAAFLSAPLTSLTPLIGAAYVVAFVQAYLRPPRVHEFQSVADDVSLPRRWWRSRLLKIFLAFFLSGLGSFIGSWVGGVEIVSNLFGGDS